ncbi:MAG: MEDS domain-containing protein [Gammaproteobacteria bacterium]
MALAKANNPPRGRHEPDSDKAIRLAGRRLGSDWHHICAFFHDPDEEYRMLLPFIKEGIEHGQKAFHIVDPLLREDHLKRLGSVGIDAAAAERSGQLELRDWSDTYLRDGHFDPNRMMALLQEVPKRTKEQGYPLTRMIAHMEWALEDRPGVNDLVEYETRLNYVLPHYKDPVICVYDLAKFGADVVVDIMRTHPMVIIGGIVQENPFFVPPDDLLRELREREGRGAAPLRMNG